MDELWDQLREHPWAGWLGLAIALGVTELLSLDLVFLMLALGALGGMTASLLGAPFVGAALVAAGVSAATLLLVRPPLVKRLHSGPELTLGHDRLVGTRAVVVERISGHQTGRVKLGGEAWSAAPYDESLVIEPGETVEVFEIRGATAYVHPLPSTEPPAVEP